MMKKLITVLALLLIPALASGAQYVGNITASGATCATTQACVIVPLDNTPGFADASATITLAGTFVATLQYEVSADGGNTWTSIGSGSAPGATTVSVASNQILHVRASSYTSGTVAVTVQTSTASTGGGTGAWKQLAQIVVSTPANTETFSSIPGSYTTLVVTGVGRTSDAATTESISVQFNSDIGANYDTQFVAGGNTVASASATSAATSALLGAFNGSTATAANAGEFTAYIPGYAGTVFNKTFHSDMSRFSTNGTTSTYLSLQYTGQWRSTAPINSITLIDAGGGNFVAGTTFTLYGVQ